MVRSIFLYLLLIFHSSRCSNLRLDPRNITHRIHVERTNERQDKSWHCCLDEYGVFVRP